MQVPISTIFEFHKLRTACHIECLNYFACLLGHHFPEHDNDKNHEPMRTGYAYMNYAGYHPDAKMSDALNELFWAAHDEHHRTRPHHVGFYKTAADISNTQIIEMICDWHSANFEQKYILKKCEYESVADFFARRMRNRGWRNDQIEFIYKTIDFLAANYDHETVMNIWNKLKEY